MGVWQVLLQLLLPFTVGHLLRPWIGGWAERNRAVLSITDRGSILLVVYTAFNAAVMRGIWQEIPPPVLGVIVVLLLALGLAVTMLAARALGLDRGDKAALVFCGSQKSMVSGVPIASALVSGAAVGPVLLPLMIYYPMQLVVCAWMARRYAKGDVQVVEYLSRAARGVGPRSGPTRREAANEADRVSLGQPVVRHATGPR